MTQLHPAQATIGYRAQEGHPEGAVLTGAHVHTDDLPPALCVDRGDHHHAHIYYPAGLPDLLGQCVQPQVAIRSAVQGSIKEALDHPVEL